MTWIHCNAINLENRFHFLWHREIDRENDEQILIHFGVGRTSITYLDNDPCRCFDAIRSCHRMDLIRVQSIQIEHFHVFEHFGDVDAVRFQENIIVPIVCDGPPNLRYLNDNRFACNFFQHYR